MGLPSRTKECEFDHGSYVEQLKAFTQESAQIMILFYNKSLATLGRMDCNRVRRETGRSVGRSRHSYG